jgi:hypothetical protein
VVDFNYRHQIEYRRVTPGGRQVHEHTEVAYDHGWYIGHSGMTREQWRKHYTRACAEDFLPRVNATPGRWVVSVYRLPAGGDRKFVCATDLTWPRKPADNDNRRRTQ